MNNFIFTGTEEENLIYHRGDYWVFDKVRLLGARMILDVFGDNNIFRGMKFSSHTANVFVYGDFNLIESCEFLDTEYFIMLDTSYNSVYGNSIVGNLFRAWDGETSKGTIYLDPNACCGRIENNVFEDNLVQSEPKLIMRGHNYFVSNNTFNSLVGTAVSVRANNSDPTYGSKMTFEKNHCNFQNKFKYYCINVGSPEIERGNIVYDDNSDCNGLSLTNIPITERVNPYELMNQ